MKLMRLREEMTHFSGRNDPPPRRAMTCSVVTPGDARFCAYSRNRRMLSWREYLPSPTGNGLANMEPFLTVGEAYQPPSFLGLPTRLFYRVFKLHMLYSIRIRPSTHFSCIIRVHTEAWGLVYLH